MRLRLFHKDDLSNQIDTRALGEGEVRIGRDAKADWQVPGAGRDISREHLVIAHRQGMVTVRDTSANGTFLGEPRQRVESGRSIPVTPGEAVSFGNYILILEEGGAFTDEAPARTVASPFDAPDGIDDTPEPRSRSAQPFSSAIKADPLTAVAPVRDDADIWDSKPADAVGSWNASPSRQRAEPTDLIGSDRHWRDPEPPPAAEASYGFDAPFARPILEEPRVASSAAAIPSDWLGGEPNSAPPEPAPIAPPPPVPKRSRQANEAPSAPRAVPVEPVATAEDANLFDHFCAGAGLSPNVFAGEDRARIMEQLGGTYRQAVLGIADLMQERTSLRNEYRMMRTTVRPDGNNPFKWVPPQRIAVELLRGDGGGYTTGARALNDALTDVKAHLLCMLAGMRAALAGTFAALSPEAVEKRLAGRTFMTRGQHAAAAWTEYVELAKSLRADTDESVDGAVNRAFREAYEAQLDELGRGSRG